MKKFYFGMLRNLFIGLVAAGGSGLMWAQPALPAVTWQNSKLSVRFEDASVAQIVSAIAARTGIQLSVDPSVSSFRESVSFVNMALHDALLKVLDGSNIDYIIVGDPKSKDGVKKLMLLGFAPKDTATAAINQPGEVNAVQPNPYANQPGIFSGRTMNQEPVPRATGQFLPFPEAGGAAVSNDQQAPARPYPPPNPFNPTAQNPQSQGTSQPVPQRYPIRKP
ncbi:MAG: hypothetical protein PHX83_09950 [Acidobacteriia bacterium]|nr:hypothetical protein [Terriglobia bacterium]